ncbi:hypothetical protein FRB98_004520 [Tulasnella sp. 332]|nr:hypothetical protein FRB98_004520 [Tulasnella sp. 332]
MSKSFEWSFSLRQGHSFDEGYESDDNDAPVNISNTTTHATSYSSSDLDLAPREEAATFIANPWTFAKLNAASRRENVSVKKNTAVKRVSSPMSSLVKARTRVNDHKKGIAPVEKKAQIPPFDPDPKTFLKTTQVLPTPSKVQQANPKTLFTPAQLQKRTLPLKSSQTNVLKHKSTEQTRLPFERNYTAVTTQQHNSQNYMHAPSPAPRQNSPHSNSLGSTDRLPPTLKTLTESLGSTPSHQRGPYGDRRSLDTPFDDTGLLPDTRIPPNPPVPAVSDRSASASYARTCHEDTHNVLYSNRPPLDHDTVRQGGSNSDRMGSYLTASSPSLTQEHMGTGSDDSAPIDLDYQFLLHSHQVLSPCQNMPILDYSSSSSPLSKVPEKRKAHSRTYQLSTPSRSYAPFLQSYGSQGTIRPSSYTAERERENDPDQFSTPSHPTKSSVVRPSAYSAFAESVDESWSTLPKKCPKLRRDKKLDRPFTSSGKFKLPISDSYGQKLSTTKPRVAPYKPPAKANTVISAASTRDGDGESARPVVTGWKIKRVTHDRALRSTTANNMGD